MKPNKSVLLFCALIFAVSFVSGEKARFDNYRVYKVDIDTEVHLALLQEIENYPDGVRISF